ncbi:hypothetical protein AYO40_01885 [Planctomycetaceae bacterium SCGC AG-212-D15]|nr:hypothetical protein AYO40_01885 [Planctomycetaceae bacterium SCGC AG-212-D15]
MAGDPDGLRILARHSQIPVERITYLSNADQATLAYIDRGVLFLMAFWSSSSVEAFAKLTDVLARLDSKALKVVVADVEGSPELYEIPELKDEIYGAGETAWVRKGKIVATSGLGMNTACFEPNTRALLAMP